MKAKAAVLFEVGKRLELCDVDVAAPQAGEVLIRMAAGGVCHSDLHAMTGHLVASLPAILGHEGAGVVADVGSGVTSLKPGDHVIPLWRLSCGVCEFCSDGRPALCNAGLQEIGRASCRERVEMRVVAVRVEERGTHHRQR